jgi:copper chaperone CopZ
MESRREDMTMAEREVKLSVKGMHCPSCQMLTQMTLSKIDGVSDAEVDFAKETARVVYDDEKTSPEDFVRAVEEAGYQASVAA